MNYLDNNGLRYFWQKLKTLFNNKLDKSQGSSNGNKQLTTDGSGNIIAENKPQINGVTLTGNKTSAELNIQQTYTASDIDFSDGQSLQDKYNNGSLGGEVVIKSNKKNLNLMVQPNMIYDLGLNYKIGNNSLSIYYCGSKLRNGIDYNEYQDNPESDISSSIQFTEIVGDMDMSDVSGFDTDFVEYLEIIVVGDYGDVDSN